MNGMARRAEERDRLKNEMAGRGEEQSPLANETAERGKIDNRFLSERDSLTGVRGYASILSGFDYEAYKGEDVYVAVCDVDNFGGINEKIGDEGGDIVLTELARAIQECFSYDDVYRFGTDEFLIVDAFVNEEELLGKFDDLFSRVSTIGHLGNLLGITLSVGYAYGKMDSFDELHEAIRAADRKMYESKRLGKARVAGVAMAHESRARTRSIESADATTYKTYEIDELTGLANLLYFRSQVQSRLAGDIGEGPDRMTLVYFNIENFKSFNEHFGFNEGDKLLLLVSSAIRDAYPGCLAARLSADQFMVATTKKDAIEGIRAVRAEFRKALKDSSIWLKAGVNVVEDGDDNEGVVCDRAKLACDTIKGRRDVYYREYDQALKRQLLLRRYVLDHFDEALEKGWIKIFYQPIMRVATGEVCDEEALARWVDPEVGLIAPIAFIPVLEDARLIHRLDLYMIRRACENFKRIREDGLEVAPVSINLSRLDFELCDIVSEVKAILAEFSVSHDMFSIEVTESALAGNQEFLKSEIDRFRSEGFEVWMDDFGSGYSSLHLLTDYKFDLVKVDMGFLRDFEKNEQSRIILAHIISMAKELGLKTLVEGVETPDQLAFLKAIGCGRAQGYLLGRPASLSEVEKAAARAVYPDIELTTSHDFYEAVGRINLMRPKPVPPIDGHYVPSDVAAAIICREGDTFDFFNVTDIYQQHLKEMGADSLDVALRVLNQPGSAPNACFNQVIDQFHEVGEWVDATYTINGFTCNLNVQLVAEYPELDAVALLAIAQN